jgi:hypothetical protein
MVVNIVTNLIIVGGFIILKEPPLNVIKILWIYLIMDTFVSISFTTEPYNE